MRSTAQLLLLLLPLVVWADDDRLGRCLAYYSIHKNESLPCLKECMPSGSEENPMCDKTISFDPVQHQEMCHEFYEVNGLSSCPGECNGKCERPTTTKEEPSSSVLTTTNTISQAPSSTASTVPSATSETNTGASSSETVTTAETSESTSSGTTSEPNPNLGSILTIPPVGGPDSTSSESNTTSSSSSSSTSDEETTSEAVATTSSAAVKSPESNTSPIIPPPLPEVSEEPAEPRKPLTDDGEDETEGRHRGQTRRPRRHETTEKEEGSGSLLWLWIILGVGGSLVVLAVITLIAVRCLKKKKEKNKKEAQKSDVESGRGVGLSDLQQLPLPPSHATPLGTAPPQPGRPGKKRPSKKLKAKKSLPLKEMAPGKVDAEHFNFEGPLVVDATGIHGELKHGTDGEKSQSIKNVVFDDKLNHVYDMGSDIEVVVQSVEKTIDGGNSVSTVEGGNTVKETVPTPKTADPKENKEKKAEKK